MIFSVYEPIMDIIIEMLSNMKNGYLNISNLNLTELPDSPLWKEIKKLHCHNNQLTKLPDLPNVEILHCQNNQLTYLPDLPNVEILYCYYNQLISLSDLPIVDYLYCSNNKLTNLPDLPNVEYLYCYNNKLTNLPDLPNVKELNCGDNQLNSLPDLPKIKGLYCENNPLIYNPKNRKVFNAIFRITSAQKIFKQWLAIVRQRQQERTYQNINQLSEFIIFFLNNFYKIEFSGLLSNNEYRYRKIK